MTTLHDYDGEEFEADIHALMEEMVKDSDEWFGPELTRSLPYMALCTGGEVGELQNLVKKVVRGDSAIDAEMRFKMVMEATDSFIYLMHVFAILQYSPAYAYKIKREENAQRFGKSTERPEGCPGCQDGSRRPEEHYDDCPNRGTDGVHDGGLRSVETEPMA